MKKKNEKQLDCAIENLLESMVRTRIRLNSAHDLFDNADSSEAYQSLCRLDVNLRRALSATVSRDAFKAPCRSAGAFLLLNRQTAERVEELEKQRRNLLFLLCRILQAPHGYRLRPSELAAEKVGDLSCLSREAKFCLYSQMARDRYRYRKTAIEEF